MGLFSRLLNRPGAQADKATGWFEKATTDLDAAAAEFADLSDAELTDAASEVFASGTARETLVRYAALAREAAERTLGERAYDTQLVGLIGLLQGHIVQMATGEGKTLVGALAAAGYALQGRRVHVVSVNDYLAVRDRTWMQPVFDLLGVSSAAISAALDDDDRREAYRSEVLYASVTEVGFDVLRDRFVLDDEDIRVAERDVVIVDEADSVLIDEARVPLVLAGSSSIEDGDERIAALVETLIPGTDYEISPDRRAVSLTDAGVTRVEDELGVELFGDGAADLAAVNLALYAKALVKRDIDYLVVDGRIKLISSSRGRVAELQRWPDGLQAAVEAKEKLETTESGEILDQMTVEELIHGYETVCGMTGTALAVGDDLREFYSLEIVPVDTHLPVVREDEPDRLYTYQESKERAIVEEVVENHANDRPVLIGTSSVAESESLAQRLVERGIDVAVLNAKDDSAEAEIIGAAGRPGAVTVSTQMAGRGTDIRLADDSVAEGGGLLVIGAGRYLSSRLDDQLRGRAGRQGDPGTSVFFTSLEDEMLTRVPEIQRFVSEGDETGRIDSKRALTLVEHAQRIAEGQNTALHRDTWRFNELMAKQRELVLARRRELRTEDEAIDELKDRLGERATELAEKHSEEVVDESLRAVLLFHLDARWVDHLAFLNDLREGIHLRTFAKEKPHEAFNTESIRVFSSFWSDVLDDSVSTVEEAEFTDEGIDLASHGLKRPSSTWTYLTTENAFGSDIENIVKRIRR
ncbi:MULTISPECIES: accessory Sec system translocase SecA2 [Brevibacterium]|uniref:Protein translocase subunit SecA n=3 Tax=Brevibacterium casei TaxID=33889 RepID=K9AUI0_9MICO|nr:accessory Sec system translocase SecA2 [Brevibacterium casei]NJE68420.1 accessory Sec system translocase SecA2 [Brevibacterium sp. LS14]SIJ32526.1 preprotein translocase subunit SecA [Mycobacteroides abscessus subsp. abscessus]EKU49731.1 preprotein translocase subunit SecA [Brevibacterium casei S18]KZE11077.1 accessory Sec system translocase SecA2 [Brevibacterium casei]MBE4693819.1 accessory Sec system translocase SecA2 [Brevibacterium casei]